VEKRVVFRSAWLPYALVAPQIAITVVFFFWPATQAVWYSFQLQDAFGLRSQFVGLQNFAALFKDGNYLASFRVTAVFSVLVAFFGIAISLLLAAMADLPDAADLALRGGAGGGRGAVGVPVRALDRHRYLCTERVRRQLELDHQ
jgi:ABC-type sugar transport system permease subunit